MLPKRSEESFKKDLSESSLFYLLKSINIDELKTERTIIPIGNDYLESLVAREVLNDDYISHDTLIPSYANTYNSRLNIINVKRKLFDGYKPNTLQSYTNGYMTDNVTLGTLSYKIYFHIRQEGNEIVVANDSLIGNMTPLLWLYYPNRNAYKAIVELNSYNNPTRYEVSLEPHPFLNGAYYMADWDGFNNSNFLAQASPITTSKKTIDVRNVIFASDVNNPFRFPAVGSYTIDTDEIYNVSTSAKALSQGQFGQFPLYAFCSDGIWALEVASDGTFSAKQPISRDVCNNADSITQIDGAVVFTTDQGLKLIQGSEVTLLSGAMDGHNVDEHTYFPENFFDKKGYGEYDNLVVQETRDFRKILKTCRIAYDYPNNMLRIFPKDKVGNVYKYYVYDLTTGEYGSAIEGEEVSAVVPSYPTSMVQKGASVFTFDNVSDNDTIRKGLLLTRPVMFSEPSSLKKINELKLHYTKHHEGTKVRMVMYVSNDSKNWVEVKSLRHGSYKYYRFGLVTNMTDDDALSGMVARYELTRTNKLR